MSAIESTGKSWALTLFVRPVIAVSLDFVWLEDSNGNTAYGYDQRVVEADHLCQVINKVWVPQASIQAVVAGTDLLRLAGNLDATGNLTYYRIHDLVRVAAYQRGLKPANRYVFIVPADAWDGGTTGTVNGAGGRGILLSGLCLKNPGLDNDNTVAHEFGHAVGITGDYLAKPTDMPDMYHYKPAIANWGHPDKLQDPVTSLEDDTARLLMAHGLRVDRLQEWEVRQVWAFLPTLAGKNGIDN